MDEKKKIEKIKRLLSLVKIEDHHTSKKQLISLLKEVKEICYEE